jgi:hypothetical protein
MCQSRRLVISALLQPAILDILCFNRCARDQIAIAIADKGWIFARRARLAVAVDKVGEHQRIAPAPSTSRA